MSDFKEHKTIRGEHNGGGVSPQKQTKPRRDDTDIKSQGGGGRRTNKNGIQDRDTIIMVHRNNDTSK